MNAISYHRSGPKPMAVPAYWTILILLTTLSFVAWGFGQGSYAESMQISLFCVGMVVTGIPHGAVDHLAYMHSAKKSLNFRQFLKFYIQVMALYTIVWLFFPGISLALFLGLSFYHFGQSQLAHIHLPEKSILKRSVYFSWGMFLLLALIGLNWSESSIILEGLGAYPGKAWLNNITPGAYYAFLLTLLLVNIGILGYVWAKSYMPTQRLAWELGVLFLLFGLCYYCPLKVAFTIYFTLWHAPQAMQAEMVSLRQVYPDFNWRKFFIKALPFSLISFIGIGLLIWVAFLWQSQISPYLLFFISISILTLPHMLVMESVYAKQATEYTS